MVRGMARTEIDHDEREPVYRQLAEIIRAQIEAGEIRPNYAVPSKRVLVQRYGVSTRTVDAAMAILRDEGLIETEPGKGLFVVPEDRRRRQV
jgi:DNA-binding GntR family transcriptional regulator